MHGSERLFNSLLGLSILSWAVLGIMHAIVEGEITLVRITVTVLNFVVGGLILFRKPLCKCGSISHILSCLPSFALCGAAFALSLKAGHWHMAKQIVFVAGGLWTVASFVYLGRNMAILPAFRSISKGGPYQIIRHPAYFGELLMAGACCLAIPASYGLPLIALIIAGVVCRVIAEERLLCREGEYRAYCKAVKWRLLPMCW